MDSVRTTPTPVTTFPPSLAGSVNWTESTTSALALGCGVEANGRPPRGHILALPTELLTVIFELANDENPFLLAKGMSFSRTLCSKPWPTVISLWPSFPETRPNHNKRESERKGDSGTNLEEIVEDPSAIVDEIHCSVPLDKWDFPLPLAISQTCSRFRTIAISTPMLWSRITIYREPHISDRESVMGTNPLRWGQARLWLSRATRTFVNRDGTLRAGIDKGILDIRIFAAMYTEDDWTDPTINERWFGASDMEEVGPPQM
jgi:hypothetical protein